MAVCGVEYDDIDLRINKCRYSVEAVCGNSYSCTAEESSLLILSGERILDLLLDILDGDESLEVEIIINDGELLLASLCKDLLCLIEGDTLLRGNEVLAGHALLDLLAVIGLKLKITVGDDTDEFFALGDRYTGDPELSHEIIRISDGMLGSKRERIGDDTILASLDLVDLIGLSLYRHILMDDTYTALSGHRYSHTMLRYGVHSRTHKRNVEFDLLGEIGGYVHLIRDYLRIRRYEKYVVKSDSLAN